MNPFDPWTIVARFVAVILLCLVLIATFAHFAGVSGTDVIAFFLDWIVAPLILLVAFGVSWYIVALPSRRLEDKVSKIAAFLLGLVIFVVSIIIDRSGHELTLISGTALVKNLPLEFIAGIFIGVMLILVMHLLFESRVMPLIITILSSSSAINFYLYTTTKQLRTSILIGTVGILIGALIYIVFIPSSIRAIATMHRQSSKP